MNETAGWISIVDYLNRYPVRGEKENMPCEWALWLSEVDSLLRCCMVEVEVFHQALVGLAADLRPI